MTWVKRFWLPFVVGACLSASLAATDGPLTNAANLRVRTNENGYMRVSLGAAGATDGPLTVWSNLRTRVNENGYLRISCDGCASSGDLAAYLPLAGGTMSGAILANANNTLDLGASGTAFRTAYFATQLNLASAATLAWSTDLFLQRELANLLSQYNSTTAQAFRLYNTRASSVSGEYLGLDFQTTANLAIIGTRTLATGTTRPLMLWSQASNAGTTGGGFYIDSNNVYIQRLNSSGSAPAASTVATFILIGQGAYAATSGMQNAAMFNPTFQAASGSASFWAGAVAPTFNSAGTFAGTLRALVVSPYLQSVTGSTSTLCIDAGTNSAAAGGGTHTSVWSVSCAGTMVGGNGGTPTIGGSGTIVTGAKDLAGRATTATTGVSTISVTFTQTFDLAPVCWATNETTANLAKASATPTVLTVIGTTVSGDTISYGCKVQ